MAEVEISLTPKTVNVILFDFDGTIADTFETILAIGNRLAAEFGYEPADPSSVRQLRNLNTRQIIRQANVPVFKLPAILRRLQSELSIEILQSSPIAGMEAALKRLKQQGNQLGIVTSNSAENVALFLQKHNLDILFDFVCSGASLFGKSRIIRRLFKERAFVPEAVIYVGDETRDIEAARKLKVKVVAVSWGFNSGQILAAYNPDILVHQPQDLVDAINRLLP